MKNNTIKQNISRHLAHKPLAKRHETKKIPKWKISPILAWLAVITLVGGFSYCVQSLRAEDQSDHDEIFRQLSLFGDVLELVSEDYVETVDEKELIQAAINGMLLSLDPHSSYLNADNFRDVQVQTKGEFGGLGIEVTMENGLVKVVSPIDDTPAHRAGIKPGDLITHLDDEPILGMTLSEAVDKMRGEVDTDIILTIRRGDEYPLEIPITRDVIRIQSVRSNLEDEIGYIRITTFNEQAYEGLKDAIKDLEQQTDGKLKGLVLDLRNNPGGLLEQAVNISDAFLERGEIVSTRGRRKDDAQRFNARDGDLMNGLPMVVLINGGSASASEIVAGALQDHRRAIIMGMPSFGKGSVQTIVPMGPQGAIRLTTARYYTPSGQSIQATGITPDITVEEARIEKIESASRQKEADLRGALENENNENENNENETSENSGQDTRSSNDDPPTDQTSQMQEEQERQEADYQLSRAFDLLRGIILLEERAQIIGPFGAKTTKQGG